MAWDWDLRLFRAINEQWTCGALDVIGRGLQSPEWLYALLGIVAVMLLIKGRWKDRWFVIAALAAVGLTDALCSQVLKPLIGRPRPTVALDGVRALLGRKSGFSMPSNHAANMAALTVVFLRHYRRAAWPLIPIALLVGYTRVYVGVHYPSDVLLGFLIGATVGLAVLIIWWVVEYKRFAGRSEESLGKKASPSIPDSLDE